MTRLSSASELARRLARDAEACAGTISPTAVAKATTGSSAMPRAIPGARSSSGLRPTAARAPPANGSTTRRASMAICSTSSARAAASAKFRDVADEARRFLNLPRPEQSPALIRAQPQPAADAARPTPRVASSPCRSRSAARWPNAIWPGAASRAGRHVRAALPPRLLLPRSRTARRAPSPR